MDAAGERFILTVRVTYEDTAGTQRVWESAERTTRPPPLYDGHVPVDGVDIVAILTGDEPHIILIKQFRPAVGRVVIEVPAGLVDAGETVEEAAIRELREETGYIGTLSNGNLTTPELFPDPGLGSTNLKIVHLTVDRADPANQNPVAQLEEGELVQEVFTVPLAKLYTTCRQLSINGYAIDSRVGTIAEGMEMAKRFGLYKN
ncbi:adp-ribose pyrophosphatase [Ophiostoma piceae UAMH 11346]|uniref:Adp-ribose pyrophosphatase n=1 Tax=Ophiostoma piceae (strain UAMH 11346) TaxID=1262450 RepID=S3C4F4_OPHP1|nr:adp-ribose pyrophosphatase [Ophiostoma piceae UAMH 11346]